MESVEELSRCVWRWAVESEGHVTRESTVVGTEPNVVCHYWSNLIHTQANYHTFTHRYTISSCNTHTHRHTQTHTQSNIYSVSTLCNTHKHTHTHTHTHQPQRAYSLVYRAPRRRLSTHSRQLHILSEGEPAPPPNERGDSVEPLEPRC